MMVRVGVRVCPATCSNATDSQPPAANFVYEICSRKL
jgi:hypothetical protein